MFFKPFKIILIFLSMSIAENIHAASGSEDETARIFKEYFGLDYDTLTREKREERWPNRVTPESIFFNERSITVPGEKRFYATAINTLSSGFKEGAIVSGPEKDLTKEVAQHLPRYFDEHPLETAITKVLARVGSNAEKTKLVSLTVGQLYRLCDILLPIELLYLTQDLPGCTHQGTSCSERFSLIREHIKIRTATASVMHEALLLVPSRKPVLIYPK